jgi:signal peptidase II
MRSMPVGQRFALVVLILVACVGCDQQTKAFATANLRGHESHSFLGDTVRLVYAENSGSFLGFGDSLPGPWKTAVFTYVCTAGVAAMLIYIFLAARLTALQVLAWALICAGGTGNLIDRWVGGTVRDFLNLGLGPIRTGIFNVADAAMMAGCFLALFTYGARPHPPQES